MENVINNLKNMKLNEILGLEKGCKMKAIEMLLNQIAEDEVFNAISHFETEEERKKLY